MSKSELFDLLVEKYGSTKEVVKKDGEKMTTICCPAHDDSTPSCSMRLTRNDKLLLYCHAGCDNRDIIRELRKENLWEDSTPGNTQQHSVTPGNTKPRKKGAPDWHTTYDYHDSKSQPLYQILKGTQHFTDGSTKKLFTAKGAHTKNVPQTSRTLFRLPHLLQALKAGKTILYVEGEKDVDSAYSLGIPATCHAFGALKKTGSGWSPTYGNILKGSKVIILPDNDEPGNTGAHALALRLKAAGVVVKLAAPLSPPDGSPAKKGYDLSDFLADGGTKEALKAHLKTARCYSEDDAPLEVLSHFEKTPDSPDTLISNYPWRNPETDGYPVTDADYAKAFIKSYGHLFRYVHESSEWVVYRGGVWKFGFKDALATQALLELAARIKQEAEEVEGTDDESAELRSTIIKSAQRLESFRTQQNTLKVASTYESVRYSMLDFDADPFTLCVKNGLVNLRTGELSPHSADALCASQAQVVYEEHCSEPGEFIDFLRICFCTDVEHPENDPEFPEILHYLQLLLGSILIGNTSLQKFILLFGNPNSGKSTLVKLLVGLLGEEFDGGYARTVSPGTFCEGSYSDGGRSATPELAKLVRARFVSAGEIDKRARLADNIIKAISGNGRLSARQLHQNSITYNIQWTLCIEANKEVYTDPSEAGGMVRRLGIIPFNYNVRDRLGRAIPDYHEYILKTESSELLAWLVQGAAEVAEMGNVAFDLLCPERFIAARDSYLRTFDAVRRFAEEMLEDAEDKNCSAQEAFDVFIRWCEATNENGKIKKRVFVKEMQDLGYNYRLVKSGGSAARGFYGVRIRRDWAAQLHGADMASGMFEEDSDAEEEDDTSIH